MKEFKNKISESKPTLVDFFASWCGPCRLQAPFIDDVKASFGDKINVLKVDIDLNTALAEGYGVRSVPTLMLFKNGEMQWRGVGVHRASQLEAKIKEYL